MTHNPLQGKICLVTGATDGLGRQTARVLAGMGATVIVHGRNPEKAEKTVRDIVEGTGNTQVTCLIADFAVMREVRDLAAQVKAKSDRLDALVNNAGVFMMPRRETPDGLETTFAVNHLAPFLLTNLLLDLLKASAPARIVTVASGAHFGGKLNLDDLQHKKRYHGFQVYADSKLMNVLFTYELAGRLVGTGVTANCLHPGFVATNFFANNWGVAGKVLRRAMNLFSISVEEGARTIVKLAASAEVEGMSGQYFTNGKPVSSSRASYDEDAQRRLWDVSVELAGLEG